MARKNRRYGKHRAHEGGSGAHMTDLENQLHHQWVSGHRRKPETEDLRAAKVAQVRARLLAAGLLTPEANHRLVRLSEAGLDELLSGT